MNLIIYLLEEEFDQFSKIDMSLLAPEYQLQGKGGLNVDFEYEFYLRIHKEKQPDWMKFYEDYVPLDDISLIGNSASYLVFIRRKMKKESRLFVICGGYAHHALKEEWIVPDFGLRVAFNTVEKNKIKSGRISQVTGNKRRKHVTLNNYDSLWKFDVDPNLEIVYAIEGKSADREISSSLFGADSLRIRFLKSFSELPPILDKIYQQYLSDAHLKEYSYFDKYRPVKRKNKALIQALNEKLAELLNTRDRHKVSLTIPPTDHETNFTRWRYRFRNGPLSPPCLLDLSHFYEFLDDKVSEYQLKPADLNNSDLIAAVQEMEDRQDANYSWKLFSLLSAELSLGEEFYFLENGTWYHANRDYAAEMNQVLEGITVKTDERFQPWRIVREGYEREENYVKQLCVNSKGFALLDQKFLSRIDVLNPNSKLELCDLISDRREFIYVKKAESSQKLTQLFDQCYAALEAIYKLLRSKVEDLLKNYLGSAANRSNVRFEALMEDDMRKIDFVFAIGTMRQPDDLPMKLPFFSKVILYRTVQLAKSYTGRNVTIIPIKMEEAKNKPFNPKKKGKRNS